MKLTVFRSDKGDCLLLSTGKGIGKAARHVLVDGGMRESYSRHVAASLSRLKKIDLVYVSHIDQDHISGVLQLMDDVVKWRVHEFQRSNGNKKHPVPSVPRPPAVAAIWHNAFHEQIGKNAGPVADMLAATAIVLSGAGNDAVRELSEKRRVLATSTKEAIQLSRRIGDGQLGIPLNPQFGGKLMFVNGKQPAIRIGGMSFFVIGPFEEDLRALRKEWNEWLR
jgi:hypothetical protein